MEHIVKITLEVPRYNKENGLRLSWEDDFQVCVKVEDKCVLLKANTDGLISLANHLLNLAQESVPRGFHLHLDENNSLEEGSKDLILEKL